MTIVYVRLWIYLIHYDKECKAAIEYIDITGYNQTIYKRKIFMPCSKPTRFTQLPTKDRVIYNNELTTIPNVYFSIDALIVTIICNKI